MSIQVRFYSAICAVSLLFSLTGCASVPRVDKHTIVRLYAEQRSLPKKHPVIFVPGMMGSVLTDVKTGRTVWGAVGGVAVDVLALPIDSVTLFLNRDDLVPTRTMAKFSWVPGIVEKKVYEDIYRIAVEAGGFEKDVSVFALSYDWRRDLVEAVQQLDALIQVIKEKTGNPDIKINLVCHSSGGLIARYYIKYGNSDVLNEDVLPPPTYAGAHNINKVIMLGVPNTGSMESFQKLHEGLWLPTIVRIRPHVAFTMPSLYELMPFDGQPGFVDAAGVFQNLDLYDADTWLRYGWSIFHPLYTSKLRQSLRSEYGKVKGQQMFDEKMNKERRFLEMVLQRAKRFHEALWNGDLTEEKRRINYILLGSDCQPTLKRAELIKRSWGWETLFKSGKPLVSDKLYGFGDRSVTKDSLIGLRYIDYGLTTQKIFRFPASYSGFVCENHMELVSSPTYMDNLLNLLLMDE
ncbi:MAG TPA: hypothetical protein PKL77_05500 [Candidatus Omnitrophota bacterium]|nr:hypothetical protein [Candidatus Omnitrophota bacterium]HPT07860.1 hypothetical protein [Candidatus Omnitrophota bacterium]